jgi:hypothetical protein
LIVERRCSIADLIAGVIARGVVVVVGLAVLGLMIGPAA